MNLSNEDKEFCIDHCKRWAHNNNATAYLENVLKLLEQNKYIEEAWTMGWPEFFGKYTNIVCKTK